MYYCHYNIFIRGYASNLDGDILRQNWSANLYRLRSGLLSIKYKQIVYLQSKVYACTNVPPMNLSPPPTTPLFPIVDPNCLSVLLLPDLLGGRTPAVLLHLTAC